MKRDYRRARLACALVTGALASTLAACDSKTGNITLGVLGLTALGASSTSSEIEQIYYVGIFDPQDQLDPQVYRIRVHGQASLLGVTKFASGWVPAAAVDSLGTQIGFDKQTNQFKITPSNGVSSDAIQAQRKLVMFGPEGFRESPQGHRLAIAMGSDPEAFFTAVNTSLTEVTKTLAARRDDALMKSLFEELVKVNSETRELDGLSRELDADLGVKK
jgi:hypothetical protein